MSEKGKKTDHSGKGRREKNIYKALLNIRPLETFAEKEGSLLDRILWTETLKKEIVDIDSIEDIWKGDITRLNVDAIVNAANFGMPGCFHPLHNCIDNVIHSAAGPRLREDCNTIMDIQRRSENTGTAKITRAYNLPSKYVLYRVGPIVAAPLTGQHRSMLESSYRSCLDLTSEVPDIRSNTFCCISTGVFGYPQEAVAVTAISTIKK